MPIEKKEAVKEPLQRWVCIGCGGEQQTKVGYQPITGLCDSPPQPGMDSHCFMPMPNEKQA